MSIIQEEMPECPLCMETFEVDDLSFFPCTCGYQICRFCWHRIRTDESGLCPACRKPYPEDPAQFKPLTDDEIHNIKKDRRLKEIQRKQKSAENRKHLANVRVVQKNLVFVVGLSQRLADPEVLRKHEFFGRFGKIHKVVINQSTSYIGSQGPSASAYVTYFRTEDALHAIGVVNNLLVDNKTIKASLGTTKYCSHFLKGTQCTKTDCMYLHDLGDEAASFSKEDIQQGKHLIYEQKLIEQYSVSVSTAPSENNIKLHNKSKSPSPPNLPQLSPPQHMASSPSNSSGSESSTPPINPIPSNIPSLLTTDFPNPAKLVKKKIELSEIPKNAVLDNSSSENVADIQVPSDMVESNDHDHSDDDLGFDPWDICSKGLADMMEKEKMHPKFPPLMFRNFQMSYPGKHSTGGSMNGFVGRSIPPLWPNGLQRPKPLSHHMLLNNDLSTQSKLLQLLEAQRLGEQQLYNQQLQNDNQPPNSDGALSRQENFKALLPNINISFSPGGMRNNQQLQQDIRRPFLPRQSYFQNGFVDSQHGLGWSGLSNGPVQNGLSSNGITSDPAIISTGLLTQGNDTPHWMESLRNLTEDSTQMPSSHFQPAPLNGYSNHLYNNSYVNASPPHAPSRMPPPGFNYAINPFARQQPLEGQQEMPTL